MRLWLYDPKVLDDIVSPGKGIGPEQVRPCLPDWLRSELRNQLQEKIASDGEPITQEQADYLIDEALARGTLDSEGSLTFRVKGTREQIVAQILEVCELWNEPMTRARAEAMAVSAIKAVRGQRVSAWLSQAILILAMILAVLLIIGIIAPRPTPLQYYTPITMIKWAVDSGRDIDINFDKRRTGGVFAVKLAGPCLAAD